MANLNPCSDCGAPAVEQVRGKMGPGDYKKMQSVDKKGHWYDDDDFYLKVEMNDVIRDDFRISCTKCDNATGWNKRDLPNMPGIGTQYTIGLWNEKNQ